MSKVYFSHDQIHERPNKRFAAPDPFQIHYHFRPARPANLCVTRDKETGFLNISAGTIGPLTWVPYTICLHVSLKSSPHTYHNLEVGDHCVISLPGKDIVNETWYTALPLLRGINDFEVAGLTEFPSKWIDIPGVKECPVNFECVAEFKHHYYSHGIIFVRVIGASIDEKVLSMSREEVLSWYPTYEVDDVANEFGCSVERLGVMSGELFECPRFPIGGKDCWCDNFNTWMKDLQSENYINEDELKTITHLVDKYNEALSDITTDEYKRLQRFFTQLPMAIIKYDWPALSALVADAKINLV